MWPYSLTYKATVHSSQIDLTYIIKQVITKAFLLSKKGKELPTSYSIYVTSQMNLRKYFAEGKKPSTIEGTLHDAIYKKCWSSITKRW